MGFYDELMKGLEEALAFSKGKEQARAKLVSLDDQSIISFKIGV